MCSFYLQFKFSWIFSMPCERAFIPLELLPSWMKAQSWISRGSFADAEMTPLQLNNYATSHMSRLTPALPSFPPSTSVLGEQPWRKCHWAFSSVLTLFQIFSSQEEPYKFADWHCKDELWQARSVNWKSGCCAGGKLLCSPWCCPGRTPPSGCQWRW